MYVDLLICEMLMYRSKENEDLPEDRSGWVVWDGERKAHFCIFWGYAYLAWTFLFLTSTWVIPSSAARLSGMFWMDWSHAIDFLAGSRFPEQRSLNVSLNSKLAWTSWVEKERAPKRGGWQFTWLMRHSSRDLIHWYNIIIISIHERLGSAGLPSARICRP